MDGTSCYRIGKDGLIEFGTIVEHFFWGEDEVVDDDPGYQVFGEELRNVFPPGHVQVNWHGRRTEVVPREQVTKFDQFISESGLVRRKGTDSQIGYCLATDVKVAVQIQSGDCVIPDIQTEDLFPLQPFPAGVLVLLGSWIGMVQGTKLQTIACTNDGSKCSLNMPKTTLVAKMSHKSDPYDLKTVLYPGKRITGACEFFQKAQWLQITKEMRHTLNTTTEPVSVIVTDVKAVKLKVRWVASVYEDSPNANLIEDKPDPFVQEDTLPKLKMIRARKTKWANRSVFSYTIKETDKIMTFQDWKRTITERLAPNAEQQSTSIADAEMETNTDAVESQVATNNQVIHTCNVNDTTEDELSGNNSTDMSLKPGNRVTVKTLITETKASVLWQDGSVEHSIPSLSLSNIWQVDCSYFPGDFVSEKKAQQPSDKYGIVQKVNSIARTLHVLWIEHSELYNQSHSQEEEVSMFDIKRHNFNRFKSKPSVILLAAVAGNLDPSDVAGQIVNTQLSGKVEVQWASGAKTECYPHELRTIDTIFKRDTEFDASNYSFAIQTVGGFYEANANTSGMMDTPSASYLATDTNKGKENIKKSGTIDVDASMSFDQLQFLEYSCSNMEGLSNVCGSVHEEQADMDVTYEEIESTTRKGIFSVQETAPDTHKYKSSKSKTSHSPTFLKTIKKEHRLLHTSLPEGTMVKGFEDRLDLYSVLIEGPKGTPYDGGLFLFDVQLLPNYPQTPPCFHFISYCPERLNPNLYPDGLVCVSLLGTWEGRDNERWNPATSNLLQVIVSIQGLILVAEPYFNEPGYEKLQGKKKGQENSQHYNETVIIVLTQATGAMVTSPAEIFRNEIIEHYQKHAGCVVNRLENWISFSENWSSTEHSSATDKSTSLDFPLLPASKGFCLSLRRNLDMLKNTFLKAGIKVD